MIRPLTQLLAETDRRLGIIASFPVKLGGTRTMDDVVRSLSARYSVSSTIKEKSTPTTKGREKIVRVVYIPYLDFQLRSKAFESGVYELPTFEIGVLAAEQGPEIGAQNVCVFLSRNEKLQCPFGCPMGLTIDNRYDVRSVGFYCLPSPGTATNGDLLALCER